MNKEFETLELFNNTIDHRFELNVNNQTVFIQYKMDNDKILLLHTETPPEIQGKGAAAAIIEKALMYIEKYDYKLIPLCPFIVTYIQHHPEWKRILDESITKI